MILENDDHRPFMASKRPCLVSGGGGGGKGMVAFHFPNFLGRLDIEVLLCVCWLDEVLSLVHCCVLQTSRMEGTALYPVCRTLFAISAMNLNDTHTYSAGAVVDFQRSDSSIVSAKILGPSERGTGPSHMSAPVQW